MSRSSYIVILVATLLLAAKACEPQEAPSAGDTVSGIVVDWVTGKGISASTVETQDKKHSTLTGPDGRYTLTKSPPSKVVHLTCHQLGYTPDPMEAEITLTNGKGTWNVRLMAATADNSYWKMEVKNILTAQGREQQDEVEWIRKNVSTSGRQAIVAELKSELNTAPNPALVAQSQAWADQLIGSPSSADSTQASVSDGTPSTSSGLHHSGDPTVGGATMYASKNIIQNSINSPINRTLVAAVRAGGLVDTLSGPGPFTVFAPTDDAFAKLPAGTVDMLVKPEDHDTLVKILTYHVVPGRITSKQLEKLIKNGGGRAILRTVQGEDLTFSRSGSSIIVTDAKGGTSTITTADVLQSNGVIHVVDTVLMP